MNDRDFQKTVKIVIGLFSFLFIFIILLVLVVFRDNIVHGNKDILKPNSNSGYQYNPPSYQYPTTTTTPTNTGVPTTEPMEVVPDDAPMPVDPEARQL